MEWYLDEPVAHAGIAEIEHVLAAWVHSAVALPDARQVFKGSERVSCPVLSGDHRDLVCPKIVGLGALCVVGSVAHWDVDV
jgi:hypothetical protein